MSKRIVAHIGILLLLFVAACTGQPNPPGAYDYCYRFDFTTSNSFTIINGNWSSSVGYLTDDAGHLALSYDAGKNVNPLQVVISAARVDSGDINAAANGLIFGLSGTYSGTLAAAQSTVDIPFNAPSADLYSPVANVSLATSGDVAVTALTVYGRGESPFGTPNCGDFIPSATVIIPTGTAFPTIPVTPTSSTVPSGTPTITPTPTQTLTPTPTATVPSASWCHNFNFEIGPTASFSPYAWQAKLGGGFGPNNTRVNGTGYMDDTYQIPFASTYRRETAIITGTFTQRTLVYFQIVYDWTAGTGAVSPQIIYKSSGGSLPWTPVAGTNQVATMSGTYLSGSFVEVQGLPYSSTTAPGGSTALFNIRKVVVCGQSVDPFTQETATPSPTSTITTTPTIGPSSTLAPTGTHPPPPTWTPNPGAPTGTPTHNPSRTPIPIYVPPTHPPATNTPAPTNTPGGATHTAEAHQTETGEANATGTATVGGTPTPGATGTPNATGTANAIGSATADMAGTIVAVQEGPAGGIGDMGRAVISTIGNVMSITFNWMTGLSDKVNGVTNAWYNTAPTPPPNLPRCQTTPMLSQLCAIYYFLTNTIFSGPVGSLIIPLAVVDVDLFILFSFIRFVRALLARAAKVIT